ncbi:PilZ domain-containing protein [Thermodesulfobacteriota bacterium]
MEFQKVYFRDEGMISIRCPACMIEKDIPSQKISGKHKFKVKCTCGSTFGVQCESRKKYRKQVNLDATLFKPEQNLRWGKTLSESQETNIKPANCQVCNISFGGIGLKILEKIEIEEGDLILVRFTLDNSASTEMEKKVIVRVVKDTYVGCEFFDSDKNDTTLGFYLL